MLRLSGIISAIFSIGFLLPLLLSAAGILPSNYIADSTDQLIPFIADMKRMIATGHPWWTWNAFLGDNFIASYSYYNLGWPIVWLLMLLPLPLLSYAFPLSIFLQTIAAALCVRYYLLTMGLDSRRSDLGAIMYALSSHVVTSWFYTIFAPAIVLFPLLTAFVEQLISGRGKALPLIALTAGFILLGNPYIGAVSLVLMWIYLFFRGPSLLHGRRLVALYVKAAAASALALGLVAVILLPTLIHVSSNPRVDNSFILLANDFRGMPYALFDYTVIFIKKIIYSIIPRTTENMMVFMVSNGWSNTLYVPVFGLLGTLLYLRRDHRSWFPYMLMTLMVIAYTPLNATLCLNTLHTYLRWGYALTLFMILACVRLIPEDGGEAILGDRLSRRISRWYWILGGILVPCWLALSVYGRQDNPDANHFIYFSEALEYCLWGLSAILFLRSARSANPLKAFRRSVIVFGTICLFFSTTHMSGAFASEMPADCYPRMVQAPLESPQGNPDSVVCRAMYPGHLENYSQLTGHPTAVTFHSLIHPSTFPLQNLHDPGLKTFFRTTSDSITVYSRLFCETMARPLDRPLTKHTVDSLTDGRPYPFANILAFVEQHSRPDSIGFLGTSEGYTISLTNRSDTPRRYLVVVPYDPAFSLSDNGQTIEAERNA
ncbi:MAG: YfhO family protein, partial [Muribaculaceae bacterium]|nr:YfhO family protein [Muribaculaceae bacterium]